MAGGLVSRLSKLSYLVSVWCLFPERRRENQATGELKGPAAIHFEERGFIRITDFPGPKGTLAVVKPEAARAKAL